MHSDLGDAVRQFDLHFDAWKFDAAGSLFACTFTTNLPIGASTSPEYARACSVVDDLMASAAKAFLVVPEREKPAKLELRDKRLSPSIRFYVSAASGHPNDQRRAIERYIEAIKKSLLESTN